jgi:hypothetical protein
MNAPSPHSHITSEHTTPGILPAQWLTHDLLLHVKHANNRSLTIMAAAVQASGFRTSVLASTVSQK